MKTADLIARARTSGVPDLAFHAAAADQALAWACKWRDKSRKYHFRGGLLLAPVREMMRDSAQRYRRHLREIATWLKVHP